MNGVFAVYKPRGWTSRAATNFVQSMLTRELLGDGVHRRNAIKVGHGGTLDPIAEGVLVLGVGHGCKELQKYLHGNKGYEVTAEFGRATDTFDAEGKETMSAPIHHLTRETVEKALPQFRGELLQVPPLYSALQMNGKRLYDYARQGVALPRPIEPRKVTIHTLDLMDIHWPTCRLKVECGSGTYMRSLVHDLGLALDSCAHMAALKRTRQGAFTLADALDLRDLQLESVISASHAAHQQTF